MLTSASVRSSDIDLQSSLGAEGEEDYVRLLRVLRAARGMFALFPIESDFRPALRDAFLARLRSDLSASDMSLQVVRLSRENWNLTDCLDREAIQLRADVFAVIGIEDTPGMIQEAGIPVRRPPALSLLNQLREALHKLIDSPMLLWCDPLSYTALMEHAPDFFDHFMGLFHFMDAAPVHWVVTLREELPLTDNATTQMNIMPRRGIPSRAALEFYEDQVSQKSEPNVQRARALLGLADSLWCLRDADVPSRLPRALGAIHEALILLQSSNEQVDYARALSIFGNILCDLPMGNRTDNLNRAIECFTAALTVYTESAFPRQWAAVQNNFGNAYYHLPCGDRNENLKQAIICYEAALRIYTETEFPEQWALTQNDLGNIYIQLLSGDRHQNLMRAIAYYENALHVFTEAALRQDWAMIQNNLGNAYCALPGGDRNENLKRAIACYEAALRVYTKTEFSEQWAATQNNLGTAYCELPSGDRSENLQKAIACYEAALYVRKEATYPQEWATTQYNLGSAYYYLPTGDRNENLIRAVACYEKALRGYGTNLLKGSAETNTNLGLACQDLAWSSHDFRYLAKAEQCFAAAAQGYRQIGMEDQAREAEESALKIMQARHRLKI